MNIERHTFQGSLVYGTRGGEPVIGSGFGDVDGNVSIMVFD